MEHDCHGYILTVPRADMQAFPRRAESANLTAAEQWWERLTAPPLTLHAWQLRVCAIDALPTVVRRFAAKRHGV
jgi:hypothetical protein